MPPNPWLLLKYDELTKEQLKHLRSVLIKREVALGVAMKGLQDAIKQLSESLDQNGKPTFVRDDFRGAKRNKPRPRPFSIPKKVGRKKKK